MQKGIATLEIVLAIMIIALLAGSTVPNVTRIIDKAALDYEANRLYSDLRFAQEASKAKVFSEKGTGGTKNIKHDDTTINLTINPANKNYQIFKTYKSKIEAAREPHYYSNPVTISFKDNPVSTKINVNFDGYNKAKISSGTSSNSVSDSLTLTSQFDKKLFITFDSVGRIRLSLTKNK